MNRPIFQRSFHMFSLICNVFKNTSWKSLLHDDGTMYNDYFIVGITTPKGNFTYHYHVKHWELFDVNILDKAPKWDGHTSEDIEERLGSLKHVSLEQLEI